MQVQLRTAVHELVGRYSDAVDAEAFVPRLHHVDIRARITLPSDSSEAQAQSKLLPTKTRLIGFNRA